MKSLIKRFKNWRARRSNHLEWWERERGKGFAAFITRTTLMYSLWMVAVFAVTDYVFDGQIITSEIEFRLITYTIAGVFMGWFGWSQNESKYQKQLREARIKAGLPVATVPQLSIIADTRLDDHSHQPRK